MEALQTLVRAAQQGDLEAFGTIVQQFKDMAHAWAYSMLGDPYLAEDVAQNAFIEAYLHLPSLQEPAAFPAWLRRIVFRQGDRLVRGKRPTIVPLEPTASFDIPLDDLNPALLAENHELQHVVRQAIATLVEHERIVVYMFYGSGYELKDISTFLEVPLSTVKKRLFDARKHLKNTLLSLVSDSLSVEHKSSVERFSKHVQLLIAVHLGDVERVKALIQRDPLLVTSKWLANRATSRPQSLNFAPGHTSLHSAAELGQRDLVSLFLEYGANINACTRGGSSALHMAVSNNHLDTVQLLVSLGADVQCQQDNGLTPLFIAAMRGYTKIARLLLESGAEVDVRGKSGRTPLHWAALKGELEMTRLLLQYDADIQARDEFDRTPLEWAGVRNHPAIIKLLHDSNTLQKTSLSKA